MKGRIPDDEIDRLRERADIVEVISGYLQLRKAGRVFKGLCCFHQEKTPSFSVDPAKQLFHCFGCGVGGDVFTFVRQVEGLSFMEAAQRLADKTGITLQLEGLSQDPGGRRRLFEANSAAEQWYLTMLIQSPEAEIARRYLQGRGFSPDDAKDWRFGFAPRARDGLFRHLVGLKFKQQEIVDSGLAVADDSGAHRDRFRGRLIFPIRDVTGQVLGFGARALAPDQQPKYLNSPETTIYRKAKILYGLDRAKQEMVKQGTAVVTEGYTDVVALHKVGVKTAVATCGTALGEDHFALIKRFCERVILAFDSDAAGAMASERGFGLHSKLGLEVLVAPFEEGTDPADAALQGGREAVDKALEQAVPLMRFVLDAEISRHRTDTPEGKAKAVRAAATILATEPSRVARGEHAFWVARRIGVDPDTVQLEVADLSSKPGETRREQVRAALRTPGHIKVEREALALLLDSPGMLGKAKAWLTPDHFTLNEHRVLFNALAAAEGPKDLMDQLPDDASRALGAELAFAPVVTQEPEEVFIRLEEFRIRRQIDSLRATLDRLDPVQDPKGHDEVFAQLMKLEEQRRRFEADRLEQA